MLLWPLAVFVEAVGIPAISLPEISHMARHINRPTERKPGPVLDFSACVLYGAGGFYCLGARPAHSGGPRAWEPASLLRHTHTHTEERKKNDWDHISFVQNDLLSFLFW